LWGDGCIDDVVGVAGEGSHREAFACDGSRGEAGGFAGACGEDGDEGFAA